MKKLYLFALAAILSLGLASCSNDDPKGDTIFPTTSPARDHFDKWLLANYTYPYNVDFKYKMEDIYTDMKYHLIPADSAKSTKLAIIAKFLWFDAYAETVGLDFIKENAPRIIVVTGTPGYTRYRTEVIGSAEGGYKVRLGKVNALTDDQLKDYGSMNNYYFHTMHHEFMHILNQKKPYDESYDNISRSDYVSGNWTSILDKKAQSMGFVSAYSMENPAEDIAELYSIYVTSTPEDWATIMKNAGNKGGTIINKKLKIIREYMSNSWNVDIELLRNAILRRGGKIGTLDLNTLN